MDLTPSWRPRLYQPVRIQETTFILIFEYHQHPTSTCHQPPHLTLCAPSAWISLVCACVLSCVWLFATPWSITCQAFLSKEFSRQEYWSGLPFSTSGDLPDPGIEPVSLAVPALAVRFVTTEPPGKHGIRYTGLNPLCVLWPSHLKATLGTFSAIPA